MIDTSPIRAFLEPSHPSFAEGVDDFCARLIAPLPEPANDDEARVQAREILDWTGGAGHFEILQRDDLRALCLLREGLAFASPLADAVAALQGLAVTPIRLSENREMEQAWVPPAIAGAAMGAFAMTEPGAGSDVGGMATTAVRDGDEYVIEGRKTLISNAGIADFYIVFARTDPDAGNRGVSAFVVGAATAGLRLVDAQVMSSPHPLGEIELKGCRVPALCRLGDEGSGFKIGMATLDRLRASVGAAACGMAARALDEAVRHARQRVQFGKPIASYQLVQDKIARMAIDLTAARLLVYRAAWAKDRGAERVTLEAAMAKAFATEAAQRIIDDAIQIIGGRGVLADHPVDRLYRSVRALRIYEGTTEIQHLIIAGQLLREEES